MEGMGVMTDFERFGYENYDQPKFYNETIQKPKKKKDRVWLVALVSAIIGGLLFSSVFVFFAPNIFKSTYAIYTETNQETINARKIASVEGSSEPLSIVEIAERVAPAVVGIQNKVVYNGFVTRTVNQGSGSGIIISEDGYIVTNYHVIEGASDVTVILNTGEEYKAKLVGKDSKTDIAVIKIEPDQKLTKAILGDSNSLRVGELAVAIGNPLGQQLSGTVTAGIISALDRNIKIDNKTMNLLQTDAAISPGNSGGALVNQYGEVIGINTAKIEAAGAEGLGFAIPISNAKPVIEDLINYGYVKGRPLIGVTLRELNKQLAYYNDLPVSEGLYVVDVAPYSGAELAGIQRGDIIVKCNGEKVKTVNQLNAIRDKHKAGDTLELEIIRDNQTLKVMVKLTEEKPELEN